MSTMLPTAADHPRPVAAMDPPHITEFASDRYIEKLNQLNAHQQQQQQQQLLQQQQQQPLAENFDASAGPSRFILPLRESKAAETETIRPDLRRDKRGFFSLRQKVSLLHTRSSHADPESLTQSRSHVESPVRKSIPFDQRFLALPNELQAQVLYSLPLQDILNLRLISKSWHTLITLHEGPIVRHHIDRHIPAYANRLYPVTGPGDLTFHHLCGIWHRLHVAAKLSFLMCEWITKDIFLRKGEQQRLAFAPQHERMRRRLIPLLFTIFHFFETYRKLYAQHLAENGGRGLKREPYTLNPIEAKIMNMYDDQTLLRVHEVFPLVISSFCRRLRPPTYVGRVERSLRGYLREKPADEVHVAVLCIGGLRQVERLWETKGYNSRRGAVDTWYNSLTKEQPCEATPAKSRRGLMSFGRKKSTGGEREANRSSFSESFTKGRSPSASMDAGYFGIDPNSAFNTSMAAGAPMSPLSRQQAQEILDDLPVLQQIWLTTAEALIMQRRIVDRPQDIKRNQQVMLDLIKEDGLDEEDEWLYGRGNPDSVRPPAGGIIDDDAD